MPYYNRCTIQVIWNKRCIMKQKDMASSTLVKNDTAKIAVCLSCVQMLILFSSLLFLTRQSKRDKTNLFH